MTPKVLVDTGFLLAYFHEDDKGHQRALSTMLTLQAEKVIPASVPVELFYMLITRMHYNAAVTAFEAIQSSSFQIETLFARRYAPNE